MNGVVVLCALSFALIPLAWLGDNWTDIRRRVRYQRDKRAARRNDVAARRRHEAYQRIGGRL